MKIFNVSSILIVGAGTMGIGIAKSFSQSGIKITLLSSRAKQLTNLPPHTNAVMELPSQIPDLIIESVIEDVPAKKAVYKKIEAAYQGKVILGTNTSGLPLEKLSDELAFPEKFVGIHYFMPAEVFPMVEVMAGPETSLDTLNKAAECIRLSGKEPIILKKPIVGYLINRLQHAILHEAYSLIESGIATVHDVDRIAKSLLGPRMCITGLIEQKDISGLSIHADAQRSIVPNLAHTREPVRFVQELPIKKETGLKAGKGFYDWKNCDPTNVTQQATQRLQNLLHYLAHELQPTLEHTQPLPRDDFDK
jgi:3-hydroxybutyryl-CoA dehydrogenase